LEKVKAHDAAAVRSGSRRALGNDRVDGLAKEAAQGANLTFTPDLRFADVVLFKDSSGALIFDVGQAITPLWWDQQRREGATRRTWLAQLYPAGEDLDWKASTYLFQAPTVASGKFIFRAPPATLKWVARARAGAFVLLAPVCLVCLLHIAFAAPR